MISISELSFGYWLIFILSLFAILIIFSIIYYFITSKRRSILIAALILLSFAIALFFSLPFQIKNQVNTAISDLDSYLATKYPSDSWVITHTDPDQLEDDIILHVRFSNEDNIVYAYKINKKSIALISYWGINGEDSTELNQSGVIPKHLK